MKYAVALGNRVFGGSGQVYRLPIDCSTFGVIHSHTWTVSTRSTLEAKGPSIQISAKSVTKAGRRPSNSNTPHPCIVPRFSITKANATPQVAATIRSRGQHRFVSSLFLCLSPVNSDYATLPRSLHIFFIISRMCYHAAFFTNLLHPDSLDCFVFYELVARLIKLLNMISNLQKMAIHADIVIVIVINFCQNFPSRTK